MVRRYRLRQAHYAGVTMSRGAGRGKSVTEHDAAEAESVPAHGKNRKRMWTRFSLVLSVILLLLVIVALPLAFRSIGTQLTGRQERTLYSFPGGEPLTGVLADEERQTESFFNVAAIDLDEGAGNITLAVSGQRSCGETCPDLQFTLVSLDDDADVRRALPPSVTLKVAATDTVFSQTVQLPIGGQPSMYPFDDYLLWLGLTGEVIQGGKREKLTPELIKGHALLTIQNQLRDFTMAQPEKIDPKTVQAINDPFMFFGVQSILFERPIHAQILAVLLITLISVSAVMAVAMREVQDLVVGIGGLVLGIWGVRSVLVPQPIPVVTSIDLALSVVILFVLVGLVVRAALHLHKSSELPQIPIRKRKS